MARKLYVLLVTDGTLIEYPPEIYADLDRGRLEAERWAWVLAGGGWQEIVRPFEDRWQVAGRDVRLVPVPNFKLDDEPWIGTYWTEDGNPKPQATLLRGREAARAWVLDDARGQRPTAITEEPWLLASTYSRPNGEEAYAVAWLGKFVGRTPPRYGGRSAEEPNTTT